MQPSLALEHHQSFRYFYKLHRSKSALNKIKHRFHCRNGILDLPHDRLLHHKSTDDTTAGFVIGHSTGGSHLFPTDTTTDLLTALQSNYIVNSITVTVFTASIVGSTVRYYPQLRNHLQYISASLHYQTDSLRPALSANNSESFCSYQAASRPRTASPIL